MDGMYDRTPEERNFPNAFIFLELRNYKIYRANVKTRACTSRTLQANKCTLVVSLLTLSSVGNNQDTLNRYVCVFLCFPVC